MTYFAWGKGAEDNLLGDDRYLFLVLVFFVIVIVRGGCGKLVGKLQAAAAFVVLEFGTKGDAFDMNLDVGRSYNRLLGPRIHDKAPRSTFQHHTTRK